MIDDEKDEGRQALDALELPISLKMLKNTKISISPQPLVQIGQLRRRSTAGIEEHTILEKRKNRSKNAWEKR